jgi:predicted esterase
MTFNAVARRVLALYGEARYGEALGLVDAAFRDHPEEDGRLTFWKACLLGISGRPEEALQALREGMERRLWWAPEMLADTDLDSVRSLPGWEDLLRRCDEAAHEFVARHPRPDPQVRPARRAPATGTLVTLHGGGADPRAYAELWRDATPDAWTVVAPVGSVPFSESEWAWSRPDHSIGEVVDQLDALGVPPPVVVAGYSQGSGVAALLAWQGPVAAAGLIMVAPTSRLGRWDPRAHRRVPTYIVVGDEDLGMPAGLDHDGLLQEAGVPVHLDRRPGLGHRLPDDLDATIEAALGWLARYAPR